MSSFGSLSAAEFPLDLAPPFTRRHWRHHLCHAPLGLLRWCLIDVVGLVWGEVKEESPAPQALGGGHTGQSIKTIGG